MLSTCSFGMIEHPLCIHRKLVLLGLEVGCFLILGKIIILISKVAVPVFIHTSNGEMFSFQHMVTSVFLILAILTGVIWNLRLF